MTYGIVAIKAAKLAVENMLAPNEAWQIAVTEAYPDKMEMQKKGCPRNAFLGLCNEGKIKGIPPGNYTNSDLNKKYAVEGLDILSTNPHKEFHRKELWQLVLERLGKDKSKAHNGQMHVVVSLWNEDLLNP